MSFISCLFFLFASNEKEWIILIYQILTKKHIQ